MVMCAGQLESKVARVVCVEQVDCRSCESETYRHRCTQLRRACGCPSGLLCLDGGISSYVSCCAVRAGGIIVCVCVCGLGLDGVEIYYTPNTFLAILEAALHTLSVAQWLGRRSLAGGLSLLCTRSIVDR